MSLRCDEVIAELSAWLDGELEAAYAREISAHLDGCAPCRAERLALEGAVASLKSLERRAAPAGFAARVLERVGAARSSSEPEAADEGPAPDPCLLLLEDGDLSAHVDHELDTPGVAAVEGHLEGCAKCRGEWEDAESVSLALKKLPHVAAPADFGVLLRARIDALAAKPAAAAAGPRIDDIPQVRIARAPAPAPERRTPWWTGFEKLGGVAAAAMLLVTIGVGAGLTTPDDEPRPWVASSPLTDGRWYPPPEPPREPPDNSRGAARAVVATLPMLTLECGDRNAAYQTVVAFCPGSDPARADQPDRTEIELSASPVTLRRLVDAARAGQVPFRLADDAEAEHLAPPIEFRAVRKNSIVEAGQLVRQDGYAIVLEEGGAQVKIPRRDLARLEPPDTTARRIRIILRERR